MTTLAAVANGIGSNLIHRAADVTLKENRPLILVPRETPLGRVHLRNMLAAQEAGAVIMPPCPGFYSRPESIQDILNHLVGRMLDHLGIEHDLCRRWGGLPA
jgi:4-hydroxy-3-polyprenylbenzoate decarboxylase